MKTILICDMIWSLIILGFTAFEVFHMGHSGWWFLFAVILCGAYDYKPRKHGPN